MNALLNNCWLVIKYCSVCCLLITLVNTSYANGKPSSKIYTYKSSAGVTSFSDIEPVGVKFSNYRMDCYACKVDSLVDWRHTKLYLRSYKDDINRSAVQYNVDPAFIRAIIHAESHFNADAVSKQGAQGLMQLMPGTALELGVKDSLNAPQNIKGGVKHLSKLLNKYEGDNRLVAAAYNAGEGAVKKYEGIPPYEETEVYVERVSILYKRYKRYSHMNN